MLSTQHSNISYPGGGPVRVSAPGPAVYATEWWIVS